MFRRFFVQLFRRMFALIFVVCLGCAAQSAPPELASKIERHVRAYYNVPAQVQIEISAPKASDFPNYDAITVTFVQGETKKNYDFLVARDGKTLIRQTRMDLSADPYADTISKIDLKGRPTRGNVNAKVVAVNYDDFQCPYCSRLHETLFPQLFAEYSDRVLFIYKDFPLEEIHPWSKRASIDANCLFAQKNEAYWDFADYIHANQHEVSAEKGRDAQFAKLDLLTLAQGEKEHLDSAKLQACLKAQNEDALKSARREGDALGIESTPTMYVNGAKVDGAVPIEQLRAILDRALIDAGVQPPVHVTPSASATPSAAGAVSK
jgi:protein-disulfide isomerase